MKKDLFVFGLPALVVLFAGLVVCRQDGYDGLTKTLWGLVSGERSLSELSGANVLGLTLFLGGVGVAFTAVFTLKGSYSSSLVIRENHQLVRHGIYAHVRHPVYFGALVAIFGAPIYAGSVVGALVLSGLVPLVLLRIRLEEGLLLEEFGEEYLAYRAQTKKLIPFVY